MRPHGHHNPQLRLYNDKAHMIILVCVGFYKYTLYIDIIMVTNYRPEL